MVVKQFLVLVERSLHLSPVWGDCPLPQYLGHNPSEQAADTEQCVKSQCDLKSSAVFGFFFIFIGDF